MRSEVSEKVQAVHDLWLMSDYWFPLDSEPSMKVLRIEIPGRPSAPHLVPPNKVPKRGISTPEGKAALVHAIAHIEFNAINLALDALYRFQDMPEKYYRDWLKVAAEEAYHFQLLNDHLSTLGYQYGDFSAHNGLWELSVETDYDVLSRMALVPRLMEARGLDVAPEIRKKFAAAGDDRMVEILHIIERDEVGHVRIGNYWYHTLCEQRGVEPLDTFIRLLRKHAPYALKGPYNWPARRLSGFTPVELAWLQDKEKNPIPV